MVFEMLLGRVSLPPAAAAAAAARAAAVAALEAAASPELRPRLVRPKGPAPQRATGSGAVGLGTWGVSGLTARAEYQI